MLHKGIDYSAIYTCTEHWNIDKSIHPPNLRCINLQLHQSIKDCLRDTSFLWEASFDDILYELIWEDNPSWFTKTYRWYTIVPKNLGRKNNRKDI